MTTNLSPQIADAARAVGLALAGADRFPTFGDWAGVFFSKKVYYHRVNVASGAQQLSLNFFNAQFQKYVTNLPQPGYLPGDTVGFLIKPSFYIEQGATLTAVDANSQPWQTDTDPSTFVNDQNYLINNGLVNLQVGQRKVIDNVYGVRHFPSGTGYQIEGIATNSNTTTVNQAIRVNNGLTVKSNGWEVVPAFPILPNDQITLTVEYPWSYTFSQTFNVVAELECLVVQKV